MRKELSSIQFKIRLKNKSIITLYLEVRGSSTLAGHFTHVYKCWHIVLSEYALKVKERPILPDMLASVSSIRWDAGSTQ